MKMNEIEKKAVNEAIGSVQQHVARLPEGVRKEAVKEMVEGDIGARYFVAPSSCREEYHGCHVGGLAIHSIHVVDAMLRLRDTFDLEDEIVEDSVIITGLFHDLGKIGTLDNVPYYIPQTSDWHRNKLGEHYKYNNDLKDGLSHSRRSLRLLDQCDVRLTDDEYQAIMFHDGLYIEENDTQSFKKNDSVLVRLIHLADSWTAFVTKK